MTNKIMTLHPDPAKQGVNMDRQKYDYVYEHVLAIIEEYQSLTPKDLFEHMQQFQDGFDGKIGWYTESLKLDLEARGVISHDRKSRTITII